MPEPSEPTPHTDPAPPGSRRAERAEREGRCPDGGYCHGRDFAAGSAPCEPSGCRRVRTAGPLSGIYPGDRWPDDVRVANGLPPRPRDDSAVLAQYRSTLATWAARYIPADARLTGVSITYDDGHDPTFTDRPASLDVVLDWETDEGPVQDINQDITHGGSGSAPSVGTAHILTSIGELLTALFAIEEGPR